MQASRLESIGSRVLCPLFSLPNIDGINERYLELLKVLKACAIHLASLSKPEMRDGSLATTLVECALSPHLRSFLQALDLE